MWASLYNSCSPRSLRVGRCWNCKRVNSPWSKCGCSLAWKKMWKQSDRRRAYQHQTETTRCENSLRGGGHIYIRLKQQGVKTVSEEEGISISDWNNKVWKQSERRRAYLHQTETTRCENSLRGGRYIYIRLKQQGVKTVWEEEGISTSDWNNKMWKQSDRRRAYLHQTETTRCENSLRGGGHIYIWLKQDVKTVREEEGISTSDWNNKVWKQSDRRRAYLHQTETTRCENSQRGGGYINIRLKQQGVKTVRQEEGIFTSDWNNKVWKQAERRRAYLHQTTDLHKFSQNWVYSWAISS